MADLAWMRAVTERIEAARRGDPAEAPAAGGARRVVFQAGRRWYALPLEAVREVVLPRPPFVRVPGASAAVCGAMNLRGRVVAVVDLAALLGLPEEARAAPSPRHVVLLDRGRGATGLLVGAVLGVEPALPAHEPRTPGATASEVELLDPDTVEARAAALFGLT